VGWVKLSSRPVGRRARRPAMGTAARAPLRAACLALVCGLLVSCGGGEPRLVPPFEPSPQIMATSTTVEAGTPLAAALESQIGDVVWTTATDAATSAPVDMVSSYRPEAPRIIAAVQTRGLAAGSVVEATWEYNDTSLDAFTTRLTLTERGAEQWLSFHIARDPEMLWPVGRYEVTISVNGNKVQQAAVDVSD
jgi:hypothetical protein